MAGFIFYDLIFLVIFTVITVFLLNKNKKNLKRQGWIFLYHSKFGLRFIDWTAKTFGKILRPMQYLVITSGYILMTAVVWMITFSAYKYITSPIPKELQNIPPIAPLIPYFPRLFNLESVFPPLYFTYFLIALAIVAVSHEFAHGIFARLNNIKVKTTGLAFFGPFFGAFVEPDEKQMQKAKKFPQLSILAAGTFANVVMTVIFVLILWVFFAVSFAPAGINFNAYPQTAINASTISEINGIPVAGSGGVLDLIEEGLNEISTTNGMLFLVPGDSLERAIKDNSKILGVFEDAPAVRARLKSPILKIEGTSVVSPEKLRELLGERLPGDIIEIITLNEEGVEVKQEIKLSERNGKAYLGIGFIERSRKGAVGSIFNGLNKVKSPFVYYSPTWDGNFVQFIYDLLWWIIVINILVALFNMLPVSILDGGRFFYLTIWGITGNEKLGKKAYGFATWFILAILLLMMVRWAFVFFIN